MERERDFAFMTYQANINTVKGKLAEVRYHQKCGGTIMWVREDLAPFYLYCEENKIPY